VNARGTRGAIDCRPVELFRTLRARILVRLVSPDDPDREQAGRPDFRAACRVNRSDISARFDQHIQRRCPATLDRERNVIVNDRV
jgi:hypothetical protein